VHLVTAIGVIAALCAACLTAPRSEGQRRLRPLFVVLVLCIGCFLIAEVTSVRPTSAAVPLVVALTVLLLLAFRNWWSAADAVALLGRAPLEIVRDLLLSGDEADRRDDAEGGLASPLPPEAK
jgi:hypothetical protein